MKPVGILGGMGPEATILLMQKCLQAVEASDDADHIPLIVHQNPQVPSRIKALIEGTGADPAPVLAQMARDLQSAGATALAMPCNTAHAYASAVRSATDLPFLDMIAATVATLQAVGVQRIGMLASPAVRLAGVFDAGLAAANITQIWPEAEDEVLALIRAVKRGVSAVEIAPQLEQQARQLQAAGADHILIACTELSLAADLLSADIRWTDSLDCLVDQIVDAAEAPPRRQR